MERDRERERVRGIWLKGVKGGSDTKIEGNTEPETLAG